MLPLSDIDIAVYLEKETDLWERRLELIRVASDALKTDEIDLVVLNNAPLTLQFQILCGRELLFCRAEKERRLFEVKVLREYWDNQP